MDTNRRVIITKQPLTQDGASDVNSPDDIRATSKSFAASASPKPSNAYKWPESWKSIESRSGLNFRDLNSPVKPHASFAYQPDSEVRFHHVDWMHSSRLMRRRPNTQSSGGASRRKINSMKSCWRYPRKSPSRTWSKRRFHYWMSSCGQRSAHSSFQPITSFMKFALLRKAVTPNPIIHVISLLCAIDVCSVLSWATPGKDTCDTADPMWKLSGCLWEDRNSKEIDGRAWLASDNKAIWQRFDQYFDGR